MGVLFGSLVIMFFLNADYWSMRESLLANGLEPERISSVLSLTVSLIGFCPAFAIIGAWSLVEGTLSLASPRIRTALNNKSLRARLGTGLYAGSLVLAGTSARFWIINFYSPEPFLSSFSIVFGLVSLLLFLVGLFLVATARPN
jgi:hypothetical protein